MSFGKWIQRLVNLLPWRWDRGPDLDWPDGLESLGKQSYAQAKHIVGTYVARVKREMDCVIQTIEAQAVIGGIYCFRVAQWPGAWIGGFCRKVSSKECLVVVGHAKGNAIMIHLGTFIHELVHLILFAMGIYGHDSRLDRYVDGWADSRKATGVLYTATFTGPEEISIDQVEVLEDGTEVRTHYDHVTFDDVTQLAAVVAGGATHTA